MNKLFRYVYLNSYSFLLLLLGLLIVGIPLYKTRVFLLIPQVIVSVVLLGNSLRLFSTWHDKKRQYAVLIAKNRNTFLPESFKIFMQAPCGRLLVKAVLKDIGKKNEYKSLLQYKEPVLVSLKKNCIATKTTIYINENFK